MRLREVRFRVRARTFVRVRIRVKVKVWGRVRQVLGRYEIMQ